MNEFDTIGAMAFSEALLGHNAECPQIIIEGELTDLNTYINAERSNRFMGAKIKKEETERVQWFCKGQKKIDKKIVICFDWYVPNSRKDPDNIIFAKKFILDGMVKAGILENDGQKQISGFIDNIYIDKENPRIEISWLQS